MTALLTSWPSIALAFLTTLIGGAGVGGILKTWLDYKRNARAQTDEVALKFVGQLNERVKMLEAAREQDHAQCEAQLSVHRHRINNLSSMLDALLMLFDMPPAKTKEAVAKIRERRAQLEQIEAIEKAAVTTAPLGPRAMDEAA